jgi:CelD/BcsL family acetyltransferase involved in cellulose biosynthesis
MHALAGMPYRYQGKYNINIMKPQIMKGYVQQMENASLPVTGTQSGAKMSREQYPDRLMPDRNWFGPFYSAIAVDDQACTSLMSKVLTPVPKTAIGTYSIEVLEDEKEFDALQEQWNELLKNSPVNSLFLTWEWTHTWWRHLAEDRKLHIILVRRERELIAIAPFCLRTARLGYLLPITTFEFLGVGYVGSDYPDLIIRAGAEQLALQALTKYLVDRNCILELSQILSTSANMSGFQSLIKQHGWQVSTKSTHISPYIKLTGLDWETYLASLGHSHRYNFRRRLKNLQKDFAGFRFEQIHAEDEVKVTLAKLIELHNLRWDERGGSDAFHRPGLLSFHADITHGALRQDSLRLYVLWLNGKIAAILYGFRYANIFYYYQSGFDISLSRYSVGMVIMGLAIKSAMEEGIEKFDFLHGNEEYKFRWASERDELIRISCVPPGKTGAAYAQVRSLRQGLKKIFRKIMPQAVVVWISSRK